ncbi:MAG TPA: carboxypeptidase regulatory-like domain-containing protein [Candidatus Didemnitutus sp.]|nr:carboxypeptidase regulatory-like domain-containing protein [Candidatus Didemnitutus sp.]
MRRILNLLAVGATIGAAAILNAGTITGTVHARGAVEADSGGGGGAYSSHKFKFADRINYEQLRDFVVYIDQPMAGAPFTPPAKPAVVEQRDATFYPHILPILVGTTVSWPNFDEIYHNVFSMSSAKSFDLQLYNSDQPSKSVVFDKPGQVDVFCAIHSKMHCIVLVLENPWFALTDDKDRFVIRNVPPGTYKLHAWHERVPGLTREVTVPADGEVAVDFVLGLGNLPKY